MQTCMVPVTVIVPRELTELFEVFPGNDKSWVILFFGMKSPVSVIPSCVATPIGLSISSGIFL